MRKKHRKKSVINEKEQLVSFEEAKQIYRDEMAAGRENSRRFRQAQRVIEEYMSGI